ncbi:MAG: tetratricopeptide repeat protein [Bacteroidia bacterium]
MDKSKKKKPEKVLVNTVPNTRFFRLKTFIYFIAFAFILYGNSISNKYSLDDELVTHFNGQPAQGINDIPAIFTSHYITHYNNGEQFGYRPIVKASFAIENSLFGENPHISHLINILLYAFTCIFLFFLLKKILFNYHIALPFLISTFFLVHPAHTEVVDSLKNRDVLFSFFSVLVALYFFIRYAEFGKIRAFSGGIFFFLFALLSKIDVLPFLIIIPLTVYFFTETGGKKIIFIVVGILFALIISSLWQHILFHTEHGVRHFLYFENPLYFNHTLLTRLGAGCVSFFFYIKLLCFPKTLISYYGYNQIEVLHPNFFMVLISVLVSITAIAYAFINFRKKDILAFGIFYFFISISMFLNILIPAVGIVAERFSYIASLGFCIVISVLLFRIFQIPFTLRESKINFWKKSFLSLVFLLVFFSSIRVIARNPDWENHFSLYTHDVKIADNSAKLNALYAAICMEQAKKTSDNDLKKNWIESGILHYEKAISIYPKYASALHNLGLAYVMYSGDYAKAIDLMKQTIACDSTYVEAYFNIGSIYQIEKKYGEAEKYYLKSIALRPEFVNPYSNLSMIYCSRKQYEKALAINDTAISRGVKSEVPYIDIGNVYIYEKDTTKAMTEYDEAMRINPGNEALCGFLAQYYLRKNDVIKYNEYENLLQQDEKIIPPSPISE